MNTAVLHSTVTLVVLNNMTVWLTTTCLRCMQALL